MTGRRIGIIIIIIGKENMRGEEAETEIGSGSLRRKGTMTDGTVTVVPEMMDLHETGTMIRRGRGRGRGGGHVHAHL